MPVDRTDVDEAERLENAARRYRRFHAVLDAVCGTQNAIADRGDRDALDERLEVFLRLTIARSQSQLREIFAERADIFVDRHLVVVENDDEIFFELPRVIESFESLAAGQCAVANHGNYVDRIGREFGGNQQSERGGDRSRRMPDTECVVFRLGAFREAADAAERSECMKLIASIGEDFMRVGLMPDIPNQFVVLEIEDRKECESQFDRAEARREMSARL